MVVNIIQGYITSRITSRKLGISESKMYGTVMLNHSQNITWILYWLSHDTENAATQVVVGFLLDVHCIDFLLAVAADFVFGMWDTSLVCSLFRDGMDSLVAIEQSELKKHQYVGYNERTRNSRSSFFETELQWMRRGQIIDHFAWNTYWDVTYILGLNNKEVAENGFEGDPHNVHHLKDLINVRAWIKMKWGRT